MISRLKSHTGGTTYPLILAHGYKGVNLPERYLNGKSVEGDDHAQILEIRDPDGLTENRRTHISHIVGSPLLKS